MPGDYQETATGIDENENKDRKSPQNGERNRCCELLGEGWDLCL